MVSLPRESSLAPALEPPLYSALGSPPLVLALALPPESPLESLLELPRVSASELLVPALASPLESLLELPLYSALESRLLLP